MSGKSAVQIAKDLGVSDSALSCWVREGCEHSEDAFPGKWHQGSGDEELRRLKRKNDALRQERDILSSYFNQ